MGAAGSSNNNGYTMTSTSTFTSATCSWYNPFCTSSQHHSTYEGTGNPPSGFPGTTAVSYGHYPMLVITIASICILVCFTSLVILSIFVRCRRRRRDSGQGIVYEKYQREHVVDDDGKLLSPKGIMDAYSYQMKRLFSLNQVGVGPARRYPSRYISVTDLESFVDINQNPASPRSVSEHQLTAVQVFP